MGSRKLIRGRNDLATTMPAIAAQWDYERNGNLRPEDVLAGSNARVWWKCGCGHEWQTAVYHRKAGHGCPRCTAGNIKAGINDLETLNRELSTEWGYERNQGLTPSDVGRYSQAAVWWRCRYGHSWKTTVAKRTRGQGCPYCAGTKVWKGFNDLATTMPKIAAQWDYERNNGLMPEGVMAGSDAMVWWKCGRGHSWQAAVYSRKAGHGCPYCAGNAVLSGYNDLQTRMPGLIREWDFEKNTGTSPDMAAPNTNRKIWWRCSRGHSWQATVYSRAAGKGCPYCAGKKVLLGFNDLSTVNPALAAEWDDRRNGNLTPEKVTASSHRMVWWIDGIGHSWEAQVANRSQGCGCPYCAGRQALPGFNDLATLSPALAAEWDFERNGKLTPFMVTVQSKRSVWWKCAKGHGWKATVSNRSRCGCPYCANRQVLAGYNDLRTLHPELAEEWDHEKNNGLKPEDVTYRTRRTVWWKCRNGHSWKAEVYERHKGIGCPYCGGRKAFPGFNDLRTASPWLADEWDYERNAPLFPDEILPFTNRKVWWRCKNGHHWRSNVNSRQKGAGCPYCMGLLPSRPHIVT